MTVLSFLSRTLLPPVQSVSYVSLVLQFALKELVDNVCHHKVATVRKKNPKINLPTYLLTNMHRWWKQNIVKKNFLKNTAMTDFDRNWDKERWHE